MTSSHGIWGIDDQPFNQPDRPRLRFGFPPCLRHSGGRLFPTLAGTSSTVRALPPGFAVRIGDATDANDVAACVHAAYARWVPIIGTKPGPMLDDYAEVLSHKQCFVVQYGTRLVGVLVLCGAEEGFLLENVAVHPEFVGRGVGAFLMSLAEHEARNRGYTSIYLYTHERMVENIAYYSRLQYAEYARRNERGFDRVYMRKVLERRAV